jgi:hypothetical protein
MSNEEHRPQPEGQGQSYESRDISVDRVVAVGLIGIILLVIILVVLNQFFILNRNELVQQVALKPQAKALIDLRAREDETLNSYKVLDPQQAIYQIPIAQAMKALADSAYRSRMREGGEQNRAPHSP